MMVHETNPFRRFISAAPFPESYGQLGKTTSEGINSDIVVEVQWQSAIASAYSAQINKYISHRFDVDNYLIKGDYTAAGGSISKLKSELGCSLWSLQKEFLLRELQEGLSGNASLLSEVSETAGIYGLLPFLASYLSMRAEKNVSADTYKAKVDKILSALVKSSNNPEFGRYLRIYWDPCSESAIEEAGSEILYYDASSPIIDRYNMLLHICTRLIAENNDSAHQIAAVLKDLARTVKDPRLLILVATVSGDVDHEANTISHDIVHLFNEYTVGNYSTTETLALSLIDKYPSLLEPYEIYLRSVAYLGRSFEQFRPLNSLSKIILEGLYHIYNRDDSFRSSLDSLSKIALMFGDSPLSYQLTRTVLHHTQPAQDTYFTRAADLTIGYYNPRFSSYFREPSAATNYLCQLEELYGKQIILTFFKALIAAENSISDTILPAEIPESRRTLYEADARIKGGNYSGAISLLQEGLAKSPSAPRFIFRDQAIRLLVVACLADNQLSMCAELVLSAFLTDPHFAAVLPVGELCKRIGTRRSNTLSADINIPLLFSFAYKDVRTVYSAYDNFLNAHGFTRPSQLIDVASSFPVEKLNLFFRSVCTQKVLARSHHLVGSVVMEAERLKLCQYLVEHDADNREQYVEEINQITQRSVIRKGIQQIDESKIYVDEQSIRATGREFFLESFRRLLDYKALTQIQILRLPNTDQLLLVPLPKHSETVATLTKEGFAVENIYFPSDPVVRIFSELFSEIRDRFVWSNEYGLNSYLSVRIRHGTLNGQIRSPFETSHLISQKDSPDGEYLPNSHWQSLNTLTASTRDRIQKLLADFSGEVDDLTGKLKDEIIQVRTEHKGTTGLFDYSYNANSLIELYQRRFAQIEEYEAFMDEAFRTLWDRTNENLKAVREAIATRVSDSLYNSLEKLHADIRALVQAQDAPLLLSAIRTCQTDVQNECNRVSGWFNVSHPRSVGAFQLDDIIRVSVASVNNLYPSRQINPTIKTQSPERYDGKFLTQFVDVFRTLLENAIVRSGWTGPDNPIEIFTRTNHEELNIEIRNQVSDAVIASDPVNTIQQRWGPLKAPTDDVVAKERGSGLKKVRKILTIDLRQPDAMLSARVIGERTLSVQINTTISGLTL